MVYQLWKWNPLFRRLDSIRVSSCEVEMMTNQTGTHATDCTISNRYLPKKRGTMEIVSENANDQRSSMFNADNYLPEMQYALADVSVDSWLLFVLLNILFISNVFLINITLINTLLSSPSIESFFLFFTLLTPLSSMPVFTMWIHFTLSVALLTICIT